MIKIYANACGMLLYFFSICTIYALDMTADTPELAGRYSTRICPADYYATRSIEPDYRYMGEHNVVPAPSVYGNAQYRYYYHINHSHGSAEPDFLSIDLDMNTILMDKIMLAVPFGMSQKELNYDAFIKQIGK